MVTRMGRAEVRLGGDGEAAHCGRAARRAALSPLNQAPSVTSVMTPLGPQVSAPNQTNSTAALWGTVGCSWASPKYPQYGPSTW